MKPMAGKKILVVDDEKLLREILRDEFSEFEGATCEEAASAKEALVLLKKTEFDIVISDIRMPDGDGLSLLDSILALPRRPMVFFCTGYSDLTREEALRRGARDLFYKPFDPSVVAAAVKKAFFR